MTIAEVCDFHTVKETSLPYLDLEEEFCWLQNQSEGSTSRIVVGKHRTSKAVVLLKMFKKKFVRSEDFFREHHYNYFLSPHPNIVNSYEFAFQVDQYFVYAQELAHEGQISMHLRDSGLGEIKTKRVINQICSALEFIHSKNLAHGAVYAENILVFQNDMTSIKLCDFGLTNLVGSRVRKLNDLLPWEPPEVCLTKTNDFYHLSAAIDSWHLGILIYYCLVGNYPWFSADEFDPYFSDWVAWTSQNTKRVPEQFKNFTPELLRLFTQLLEPYPNHRAQVSTIKNFLSEPWLIIDQFYMVDTNDVSDCMNSSPKSHKSSFDINNMRERVSAILHIKK